MAQLCYPLEQATPSAVATHPVGNQRSDRSRTVRTLLHVWHWACRHAERVERIVPYY